MFIGFLMAAHVVVRECMIPGMLPSAELELKMVMSLEPADQIIATPDTDLMTSKFILTNAR